MVPLEGHPRIFMHSCAPKICWGLADSNWRSLRIHGNIFSTADTISALVEVVLAVSITQLRVRLTTVRTNER